VLTRFSEVCMLMHAFCSTSSRSGGDGDMVMMVASCHI